MSADKHTAALSEDAPIGDTDRAHRWIQDAAAELRRLSASNDELIEALDLILQWDAEGLRPIYGFMGRARAALTRAKEARDAR